MSAPMRTDAHQHFWNYDPAEYAWIGAGMETLRRSFGPTDLSPLLAAEAIDGCIAVQARQSLDETRWLLDLAREHDFIRGIVGWIDLRADEAADQLDLFADEPKLVGIRHVVQDETDDEFLLREDFRRGVALLAERGLVYDVLIYPRQLPAALRFVDRFPEQPFVLDHLAKPLIKDGIREPWAAQVRELAKRPNVACKVSGMVTEADWTRWRPDDFTPYLDTVFEAFGEERLLFGSDWPVCLLAADYPAVTRIVTRWAEALGDTAREKLFGGNAGRIYGLVPHP